MAATEKRNKTIIIILVLAVFLTQLALNCITPYVADELIHMPYERDRTQLISRAFSEAKTYYLGWGGRALAVFTNQIFNKLDKAVFNVANAFMYTLITLAVYILAKVKRDKSSPVLYALTVAMMWFFIPVMGQTTLWLMGSCNYLWGACYIVCFLCCFKYLMSEEREKRGSNYLRKAVSCVGIALLGLMAGASSENGSPAALIAVLAMIAYRKYRQKRKLPLSGVAGTLALTLGCAFVLLSPGNAVRAAYVGIETGSFTFFIGKIALATNHLVKFAVPIVVFFAGCVALWTRGYREELFAPTVLFISGLAANYALALATMLPERALIFPAIFIISASIRVVALCVENSIVNVSRVVVAACAVIFITDVAFASMDIACSDKLSRQRDAAAREFAAANHGKGVFVTYSISPLTSHNAFYGLDDVEGENGWINSGYSYCFGIEKTVSTGVAYDNWGSVMSILLNGYETEK
ncbi:MAG: DUF6056 family protein [Oscillospiraceae bacterium]